MLKFYNTVFHVMGKALSGKLSFMGTGLGVHVSAVYGSIANKKESDISLALLADLSHML